MIESEVKEEKQLLLVSIALYFVSISLFLYFLSGFTTDGEFNSLIRTKGQNRPVSIIEVIKEAKKCVKSISAGRITEYFTVDEQGKSWKH